jgi:hypothetical protein
MDFLTSSFLNFHTEENFVFKTDEDYINQDSLLSIKNNYSEDFNYEANQYYYLEPSEIRMMPISNNGEDTVVSKNNKKSKNSKSKNKIYCSKEDSTNSTIVDTPNLELDEDSQVLSEKESQESFLYKKRSLSPNSKRKKEKCKHIYLYI